MPAPVYPNFTILITQSPKGYQARVIDSPVGDDAAADFALPAAWGEVGDALWRDGSGQSAVDLGRQLYDTVFAGAVGTSLVRNLERAGNRLRIVLRLDKGLAHLAALPWEFLYSSHLNRYLAPSTETPLVRYLEVEGGGRVQPVSPPLVVLGLLSNPEGVDSLDVEEEWGRVREAVTALGSEQIRLERVEATWSALQERLRKGPVHVLHFIGHGFFDPETNRGGLLLQDADRQPVVMWADQFKTLLHDQAELRLVFLNACEGAASGRSDSFAGVAQQLVQQKIPAVVAMQYPVSDQAALTLSREFYKALADGYPVDAAVGEARKALFGLGDSLEWGTPVLFSRSTDNRLIEVVEPIPPCPYPGMRPFTTAQAGAFYGRDTEIADALDRLRRHSFLTVIGPSGSGKSSLVFAGIIPALKKSTLFGPGEWMVMNIRPGASPLAELMKKFDPRIFVPEGKRILLVVDQFEETFTLASTEEKGPFQLELKRLIDVQDLFLVLTVRADFYSELMTSPLWSEIRNRRLDVTPMGEAQLREAIVRPAKAVGVVVEPALVERLVADAAGEPGVMPLVQEAMILMWDKVDRGNLPLRAYESLSQLSSGSWEDGARHETNGLKAVISRHADEVYNDLSEEGKVVARLVLLRLVKLGEDQRDTRRQATTASLHSSIAAPIVFEETLHILTEERLLTMSGEDSGESPKVDISHEILINGWHRLGDWIDQNREWLRLQDDLSHLIRAWERDGKAESHLPRWNNRLAMICELSQRPENAGRLTVSEVEYLEATYALKEKEEAEAKQRRQSQQRRFIVLISALFMVVMLSVVAAMVFRQNQIVQSEGRSRSLADEAINQLENDPELSVLLASHALLHERYTVEAEKALRESLQRSRIVSRMTFDLANPQASAVNRSSSIFSVGFESGVIRTWSTVEDPLAYDEFLLSENVEIRKIALSPSGNHIGAIYRSESAWNVKVWRRETNQELIHLSSDIGFTSIDLYPNDQWMVVRIRSDGDSSEIIVLNFVTQEAIAKGIIPGDFGALSVSPDGRFLAVVSLPTTVSLMSGDLRDQYASWEAVLAPQAGEEIQTIEYGSDGRLAIGTNAGGLSVWDTTEATRPRQMYSAKDHASHVLDIAISPDGNCLATAGRDHKVLIRDEAGQLRTTLLGHTNEVESVGFRRDLPAFGNEDVCGNQILTLGLKDGTARTWNIGPSWELDTWQLHDEAIEHISFSSDCRYMATASDDHTSIVVDIEDKSNVGVFPHEGGVNSIEFNRADNRIVTASDDGTAAIWPANFDLSPVRLETAGGKVLTAAFQPPNGQLVVTGDDAGQVILWDSSTGERIPWDKASNQPTVVLQATDLINTVAFSQDGTKLAVGLSRKGKAYVVDMSSKQIVTLSLESGTSIYAVKFPVSGSDSIFTLGSDGKVLQWKLSDGGIMHSTVDAEEIWTHSGGALAIALDSIGHMASSGRDGRVSLWKSTTDQRPVLLAGDGTVINDVEIVPGGATLASANQSGQVRFYMVDAVELANFALAFRTTRPFSVGECERYAGTLIRRCVPGDQFESLTEKPVYFPSGPCEKPTAFGQQVTDKRRQYVISTKGNEHCSFRLGSGCWQHRTAGRQWAF